MKIAVVPGDGIGNEVVPEGIRVLEAVGRRFDLGYSWDTFDWSCQRFAKTGAMMPADGLEQIAKHDAIYLGAVGYPGVPDHVSLWGLLIPIRRGFQQYINLRPVRLFQGLKSPLADRKPGDIDYWIVRENNEGEYSSIGGRMYEGTEMEAAIQQAVFSKKGCDRVMRYAFELAKKHGLKSVTSATKSNGISISMPYWDERFAAISKEYPRHQDQPVPHRHPDRAPGAQSRLVRRDRRLQPVRRHPVGPRSRHHRHDRHCARRQHQPGARVPLHVRAGARQRARHRRARASPIRSGRSGRAP